MKENISKIKRSINLYPIFYAFSADLIFFVPIDTLFLTLVKKLNASEISAIAMLGLLVCILFKKLIIKIIDKIGNANSIKLGVFLLLLSTIIVTFGNSFMSMVIYKILNELAFMFWNMATILLKNDLIYTHRSNEYYFVRNRAKVLYGIMTMITALISGFLFNINNYLPMYISIITYFIIFLLSFNFYEAKIKENDNNKEEHIKRSNKIKTNTVIFLAILSSAVYYSVIRIGQSNSKLFMQYDFQKVLSIEMVTYYITVIVFLSRISRIIGNLIFGKIYLKIKDRMSILLTCLECAAFLLLILGHFIKFKFVIKVILMSLGFFLILGIRDSFQVYIEDVLLRITKKEEQQKIMIDIEVYRKLGQLILNIAFTLILMKYDLIVIEFILLILSVCEVIINKKMYKNLKEY